MCDGKGTTISLKLNPDLKLELRYFPNTLHLQVAFLEGSDVYLATTLAFLRMHETEPAHFCIGTLMAHLDLCQSGMYEVDILLHQVKMSNTHRWLPSYSTRRTYGPWCACSSLPIESRILRPWRSANPFNRANPAAVPPHPPPSFPALEQRALR